MPVAEKSRRACSACCSGCIGAGARVSQWTNRAACDCTFTRCPMKLDRLFSMLESSNRVGCEDLMRLARSLAHACAAANDERSLFIRRFVGLRRFEERKLETRARQFFGRLDLCFVRSRRNLSTLARFARRRFSNVRLVNVIVGRAGTSLTRRSVRRGSELLIRSIVTIFQFHSSLNGSL